MAFDEFREQRETLNRVRPQGKGSIGPRKPRKDGKPHTRKQSKRESERADDVVKEIVKAQRLELPESDRKATEKLLKEKYQLETMQDMAPDTLVRRLSENENRKQVIQASRRYLNALMYAYAVYEFIVARGDLELERYICVISEKTSIPLDLKFDLIAAVCQLVIDYERDKDSTDHRRKWSRDAQAIRWLLREGIKPHQVLAFQKKHGGGVDKWSRLMSERAGDDQKKQQIAVTAIKIERDAAKISSDDGYLDDDRPQTEEELDRLHDSPEKVRLRRLADGEPWLEGLLYAVRAKGIQQGEGMLMLVVGDGSRIGARHIGTYSIGNVPDTLFGQRNLLFKAIRAAKAPKNGKVSLKRHERARAASTPNSGTLSGKAVAKRVWG